MGCRYEYPEDRFDFYRWRKAPGPCKEPYWWFNEEKEALFVDMTKARVHFQCCVSKSQLERSRDGWRRVVARMVRNLRAAIREAILPEEAKLSAPVSLTGKLALEIFVKKGGE